MLVSAIEGEERIVPFVRATCSATSWMDLAKCKGSPTVFYSRSTGEVSRARSVCNGDGSTPPCPVRNACLHHAIDNGELYGVWGGMSERDRSKVRRARRKYGNHIYTLVDVRFPGILYIRRRKVR